MSKENHKNILKFYDLNSDYSKRFLSNEETLLLISSGKTNFTALAVDFLCGLWYNIHIDRFLS